MDPASQELVAGPKDGALGSFVWDAALAPFAGTRDLLQPPKDFFIPDPIIHPNLERLFRYYATGDSVLEESVLSISMPRSEEILGKEFPVDGERVTLLQELETSAQRALKRRRLPFP